MSDSKSNLEIYDSVRTVPESALKTIEAGRLKGKSDINPMWRIKKLTETFGPAGFGGCGHAFLRDVEIDCRGSCELTVISRGAKLTLSGGGPHAVNMGGGRYEFILSFGGSLRSFTVAPLTFTHFL